MILKVLLISFIFLLTINENNAESTEGTEGNALVERLDALEAAQRKSQRKIEKLEEKVKEQEKVIKHQKREMEGLEFIVHKHRERVQKSFRFAKVNKRYIRDMYKALYEAGLIDQEESDEEATTEPNDEDFKRKGHGLVSAAGSDEGKELATENGRIHEGKSSTLPVPDGQSHKSKHRSRQQRIIQRRSMPDGEFIYKRQERAGVAFSVYLDHDVNFGAHQTIKFNQIITNEGNGYNMHSGVFTCPESGMYLFSFFVGQRDDSAPRGIAIELMVNSKNVLDAVVDSFSPGQDVTGGNVAIVRLNQGDVVWIDSKGNNGHAEGSTGLKLTSFSGVFIYP